MLIIFIAAFFCVLNITLWFVFLSKFKSIFSTEDVIKATREELSMMIADINRNTGRDIELIEDRLKELKSVIAEADRHVQLAKSELEKQAAAAKLTSQIETASRQKFGNNSVRMTEGQRVANKYSRNGRSNQNLSNGLLSEEIYSVTNEGNRFVKQSRQEEFDFSGDVSQDGKIVTNSGTVFQVENDGSSYTNVPVIGPNVTFADNPIQPKKKFADLVWELYNAGTPVESIARQLDSSTTEVQLVIDMGF